MMRGHWVTMIGSMVLAPAWAGEPACGPDCDATPLARIATVYTGDAWRNASGGIATGNRYLDNLDVTLELSPGSMSGLGDVRLFAYLLHNQGDALAEELTGAAQGISNIETTGSLRLYELWLEWQVGRTPGTLRFGLYDLNSEFDAIETASLFINPSNGIGPDFAQSGHNGPSIFPNTSLALRYGLAGEQWSLQFAALDGVPGDPDHPDRTAMRFDSDDGVLLVTEVNYRAASGFRAGLGYWQYTGEFDDVLVTEARRDNAGLYGIVETPLLLAAGERGARFFVRAGQAEARINPIEHYLGFGGVYTGLLPQRPEDQIGLAVSIARLGEAWRSGTEGDVPHERETILELTYRIQVLEWLALQPDIQYVRHPGMDPGLEDSWLFGLRFEVSREWAW